MTRKPNFSNRHAMIINSNLIVLKKSDNISCGIKRSGTEQGIRKNGRLISLENVKKTYRIEMAQNGCTLNHRETLRCQIHLGESTTP